MDRSCSLDTLPFSIKNMADTAMANGATTDEAVYSLVLAAMSILVEHGLRAKGQEDGVLDRDAFLLSQAGEAVAEAARWIGQAVTRRHLH